MAAKGALSLAGKCSAKPHTDRNAQGNAESHVAERRSQRDTNTHANGRAGPEVETFHALGGALQVFSRSRVDFDLVTPIDE